MSSKFDVKKRYATGGLARINDPIWCPLILGGFSQSGIYVTGSESMVPCVFHVRFPERPTPSTRFSASIQCSQDLGLDPKSYRHRKF